MIHRLFQDAGAVILLLVLFGLVLVSSLVLIRPFQTTPVPASSPIATETVPPLATTTPQPSPAVPTTDRMGHPILGDKRIREAIASCTDRALLLKAAEPWLETQQSFLMDSIVPTGHPAYGGNDPGFLRYAFAPEKGMEILEATGWHKTPESDYRNNAAGEELSLKLITTTADFRVAVSEAFIEQMKTCGIRLTADYQSAEILFGTTSPLRHGDFDLAFLPAVYDPIRQIYAANACSNIPDEANQWQGENYSGWCNLESDNALLQLEKSLELGAYLAAYRSYQLTFAQDIPAIPLFQRSMLAAARIDLDNFAPHTEDVFTWNADQWKIPEKAKIVIGESSEPSSLFALDPSYVNKVIGALVYGQDYTRQGSMPRPGMLTEIPSLENGKVELRTAANGESQLAVSFTFDPRLTWSDGEPVIQADYELGYRAFCDPATGESEFLTRPGWCDQIDQVELLSDFAYRILWKPGISYPEAYLPPLPRLPSHQVVANGTPLTDVPPRQWLQTAEVTQKPLGVGPYRVVSWESGKAIVLEANPFYYAGPPATPNIVISFVPQDQAASALLRGEVDVLGEDSTLLTQVADYLAGQQSGKLQVHLLPVLGYYEKILFNLRAK